MKYHFGLSDGSSFAEKGLKILSKASTRQPSFVERALNNSDNQNQKTYVRIALTLLSELEDL